MDSLHILGVLMWKHSIVRLKRYIFTPFEFLFPVLCFLLLYFNKEHLVPRPKSFLMDKFNIHNTDPMLLSDFEAPTGIYYSPQCNFTDTLMAVVSQKLYPKQQSSGKLGRKTDAIAVSSYQDLLRSNNYLDKNVAIVDFLDVGGKDAWPRTLNYSIRMNGKFFTQRLGSVQDDVTPHENYGTVYQRFMRLQWAIDTSYVKIITGNDITQRVTVQEFPFVRRTKIEGVDLVCSLTEALCWMSLLLPFLSLVGRLVEERLSGIEGLLNLAGVKLAMLKFSHLVNMLPVCLIYCVYIPAMLTSSSTPLIPNSSGALMGLFLMLNFFTIMALGFIVSSLISSSQYVTSIALYVFALARLPIYFLPSTVSGATLILGLLPNVPLKWYWWAVEAAEQEEMGVNIGTLATKQLGTVSPQTCLIFLLVQLVVLGTCAWAMRRCGRLRTELSSWKAFVAYCRGSRQVSAQQVPLEEPEDARGGSGAEYFEPVTDKVAGVRVLNVSKVYNNQAVLRDVSLDIYQGEITVLLGHNGAGKTTLMSIITGMTSPTSGRVHLEGQDVDRNGRAARRRIGLCPQHNLFIPYLTVLQHVMFFTMLKGSSYFEAKKSSLALLQQLGIGDKASRQSAQLSGGMKRRLQLACALAGDSSVLVLDEPTAGLDVETRRGLWDLLLSLRGSRTVLISTHFMEEADALGDRVAALHEGRLRCHATTMHLKRTVGTGYRLSFTTIGVPKEDAITALVRAHVPDAVLKAVSHNSLTYALPAKEHTRFPKLFSELEEARSRLAIDTIGVGVSTIEEVFLKLCSDMNMMVMEDELDAAATEPTFNKVSGLQLCFNQIAMLFRRQLWFLTNKKLSYVIVYWVLPFLVTFVVTVLTNNDKEVDNGDQSAVALTPELYRAHLPERRVLIDDAGYGASVRSVTEGHPHVTFEHANDLYNTVMEIGRKDSKEYARYLAAIEVNSTDAKMMYSTVYPHAAPVGLSLLSTVLATESLPWASGRVFAANNHPLEAQDVGPAIVQAKTAVACVLWTTVIVFLTMATMTESLTIAVKERVSGARRIYIMAGCPPELFWFATLATHVFLYGATLVAAPLIAAAVKDADSTLTQPDFLGTMALVLILGMLAFMPLGYLLAFRFNDRATGMLLFLVIFVFGIMTPAIKTSSEVFSGPGLETFTDYAMYAVSLTAPPHTLATAAGRAVMTARLNALCNLNRHRCPALSVSEPGFDAAKCCANENPRDYFSTDDSSPAWPMFCLVVQAVCLMILVCITERGYVSLLCDRAWNVAYKPRRDDVTDVDDMARAERAYVSKAIRLPDGQIPDVMLVDDIHKNYPSICGKSCNAVRGVSFAVKKGECFGLLGVNGAGKSTTFKMLTTDEPITLGEIYANGHRLDYRRSLNKYMQSFGYCPQFFGLDQFLSGMENLRMVLTMRGMARDDVDREARAWIEVVGLQKYATTRAQHYSGGCARRLATAAALCGGARITLLDEPSAGVDVGARRRVWAAVRRAQRSQRSLIISSHSMEEMEALCGRIAIMSRGRVRALGAAAALRAAHAAGHAVLVKLRARDTGDVTDSSAKPKVQELKSAFHHAFDCTLKDEHTTMLHFHINESMSYSNLFGTLEALQRDFPHLVEDYSVTETTLEEVFLAFAREAQETGPDRGPAAV